MDKVFNSKLNKAKKALNFEALKNVFKIYLKYVCSSYLHVIFCIQTTNYAVIHKHKNNHEKKHFCRPV